MSLQTLVKIIFNISLKIFSWDPLEPKRRKFHIWSVGYQNGVWSSFLKEFLKNIKKLRFWFDFWSNFDAFFRHSNLKTENFLKKKLRVGYVYIEESFNNIFSMGHGRNKSFCNKNNFI